MLTRRRFLELGGVSLATLASAPVWLSSRRAYAKDLAGEPLLVVIFLRGAADGLHLVPPVGDAGYARARGTLALGDALSFATGFGLHPALAALTPLVARGELAAVHAVGSDDRSRSHFEAQDRMELADPGHRGSRDGWLARALATRGDPGPFSTLSLSTVLPLSLRDSGAFAIGDPQRFGLPETGEAVHAALVARYAAAGSDAVAEAGRRALAAIGDYGRAMGGTLPGNAVPNGDRKRRTGGARRADPPLPERVRQLLALERAGLGVQAVALECHGWDTHQRQGLAEGAMARPLKDLGAGLAALADGLRGRRDWLVVVMTEFGRTVRPNGSQGSDHGHGSVMLVAGPRVRAGVHGPWPGLGESALYEGRDLAVATDYRHVLFEILKVHLGGLPPADTFPGFSAAPVGLFG